MWVPASHKVLPIQVIAQQWEFTYRYPTFGGFETSGLVIPAHTTIAFHVTSLDVIHSFWAYQLEVKADANPDYDNVAYTETTGQLGQFTVRCSELCGLWHGAMYDTGRVVSIPAFMSWATSTEKALAPATKLLPPFAWTYTPDANGADGSYYPDDRDPYSNIETYGARRRRRDGQPGHFGAVTWTDRHGDAKKMSDGNMAITGLEAPGTTTRLTVRPAWVGQHVGTAAVGGIVGYVVGHWLGNLIASGYTNIQGSGQNDVAVVLALAFMVLGWMGGIGAFNYPAAKIVGREPLPEVPRQDWVRYFRFTTDHKVVGIQYLVGVLTFFFTGGLLAMAIRTELLTPTNHFFGPAPI